MNTSNKVRIDSRSLYIRRDAKVYRPIEGKYSYPLNPGANLRNKGSEFPVGTPVKVSVIAQSPFARVVDAAGKIETWHSHGSYYGSNGRTLESHQCWQPKEVKDAKDPA